MIYIIREPDDFCFLHPNRTRGKPKPIILRVKKVMGQGLVHRPTLRFDVYIDRIERHFRVFEQNIERDNLKIFWKFCTGRIP